MAIAPARWLRDAVGVYVGNATAVRDYRVQLRGNRAILLWALYLVVLISFGLFTYSEAAASQQMSIVDAQRRLNDFYDKIVYLLSTMIVLIAPALSATAIVAERQRKSLDLVFSAPVSPKYYLVGKLISSYRYIWMLLVLSLPITAACVVLGGAIWSEVLATYALLSLHGLIYTSLALLISTLAQKPVGAIVWSYIGAIAYNFLIWSMAGPLMIQPYIGTMMRSSPSAMNELPFVVTMIPFLSTQTATSYTVVGDYRVPNWSLAIVLTLVIVRIILAAAGSALSPFGSKETKSLRVQGLVYMYLFTLAAAALIGATVFAVGPMMSSGGTSSGFASPAYDLYFARQLLGSTLLLIVVIPVITCFGVDLEKKFWPDGVFRIRRMLTGTPSGGLPYIISLVLAGSLGTATYLLWHPTLLTFRFFVHVGYALALVFACWSLGRLTSAMNNGLRYARTLQLTGLLALFALPIPFLAMTDSWGYSTGELTAWDFYILRPLFASGDKTVLAAVFGVLLVVVGALLTKWSEVLAKSKYEKMGLSYGRQED